jgi:hypothetical protein
MIDVFTIIAWIVLAVLFLVFVAAIVYLGSLPGNIAKKRNHPQADAINAASWIGLALLGSGWPIAFVWAFLKRGPAGSDINDLPQPDVLEQGDPTDVDAGDGRTQSDRKSEQTDLASIASSLAAIEQRLTAMEQQRD